MTSPADIHAAYEACRTLLRFTEAQLRGAHGALDELRAAVDTWASKFATLHERAVHQAQVIGRIEAALNGAQSGHARIASALCEIIDYRRHNEEEAP